ncbi:MAG: hypothetical protein COB30_017035 [Ectothiorhodospiraceae bacterium]|nr:hypothetical protein [Ectothiorhodospiraceae bacterium]
MKTSVVLACGVAALFSGAVLAGEMSISDRQYIELMSDDDPDVLVQGWHTMPATRSEFSAFEMGRIPYRTLNRNTNEELIELFPDDDPDVLTQGR